MFTYLTCIYNQLNLPMYSLFIANKRFNRCCYSCFYCTLSCTTIFFPSNYFAGMHTIYNRVSNIIIHFKYCLLLKQGIVYQLDIALENVKTQKCGLVFIYDMSDSKYSNFDYDLSQKILTLLKVSLLNIIYFKLTNP